MVDFKIRRGPSSAIFISPGVVNPKLVIEEGCWYLCTDTAWLFLGATDNSGKLVLKRINETEEHGLDPNIEAALNELRKKLDTLEELSLFQKIDSESDLPTDFTDDNFNPNITYYIPIADGKVSTFIFDVQAQCYVCTNSIDELIVRAMVTDAIELVLEESLNAKLPKAVKNTLEYTILHGGNANA